MAKRRGAAEKAADIANDKKRLGSMNPEEIAELKELIEFLKANGIGEFDLERGDLKVRLKFAGQPGPVTLPHLAQFAGAQRAAGFPPAPGAQAHPAGAAAPAA